ncbi:group II intron maturase-specific domain-containing protein [Paenibacillus sepulcri]
MRHVSFEEHVRWLNLRIQGWKNYYATPYSTKWMTKLDGYIRQRLTKWYAKKRQRSNWRSSGQEVKLLSHMHRLKALA